MERKARKQRQRRESKSKEMRRARRPKSMSKRRAEKEKRCYRRGEGEAKAQGGEKNREKSLPG